MRYCHSFFHNKSLKSGVYFTLTTHLDSDAKFSLKIFDLHLDFIKFAVEKVDCHTKFSRHT